MADHAAGYPPDNDRLLYLLTATSHSPDDPGENNNDGTHSGASRLVFPHNSIPHSVQVAKNFWPIIQYIGQMESIADQVLPGVWNQSSLTSRGQGGRTKACPQYPLFTYARAYATSGFLV